MFEIVMPKLNNNDDDYVLLEWLVDKGGQVSADTAVATVETSKTALELIAAQDGFFYPRVEQGASCCPGETVAYLFSSETEMSASTQVRPEPTDAARKTEQVVTKAAQDLADLHGLTTLDLQGLQKRVIRKEDIETFLDTRSGQKEAPVPTARNRERLSRLQLAVAATVAESHATIPAAFHVAKVHFDHAAARHSAGLAGIPERVVHAIAASRERFPLFFSSLEGGDTLLTDPGAHIGVTIDVGTGLYIPVLRDAETKTVEEIAAGLMRFRLKARRRSFAAEELAGSNIVVSLNLDQDIILTRPIIPPGHVCAVGICAMQEELAIEAGKVISRSFFNLGLVYDHRAINGYEATRFLTELKSRIEALHGPRD